MDLNYILAWLTGTSCTIQIFRAFQQRNLKIQPGWMYVTLGTFSILLIGTALWPKVCGYIAATTWLIFLFLPSYFARRVERAVRQQDFKAAADWSRLVRILHPFDGWQEMVVVYQALVRASNGEINAAQEILSKRSLAGRGFNHLITLELLKFAQAWAEILQYLNTLDGSQVAADPYSLSYLVRGLGETGQLNKMVAVYNASHLFLKNSGSLESVRMIVLAFCGRTELLQKFFARDLQQFSESSKTFWLITAKLSSGHQTSTVKQEIKEILEMGTTPLLKQAYLYRLEVPPAIVSESLSSESANLVDKIEEQLQREQDFEALHGPKSTKPTATLTIIFLNIVIFLFALADGFQNTIVKGALIPQLVRSGEWWRIITAQFLHLDWLHLCINMLCLYGLGRLIETVYTKLEFILIYLASGSSALLLVYLIDTQVGGTRPTIYVGASAGIMSLVGANIAYVLQAWRLHRSALAASRLKELCVLVSIQVFFDLSTPQVSMTGHLAGLAFGVLFTLAVSSRYAPRGRNKPLGRLQA